MIPAESDAYQAFLDFFKLSGRQRMGGLDSKYFSGMSPQEKESAFSLLRDRFYVSEESIRGMFFCNKKRALSEFREAVELPFPENISKRERDNFELCKSIMLNYICQDDPSAYNIDRLAAMGGSANEDTRAYVYQSLPSMPITNKVLDLLKSAIFTESERIPLSSAISKFIEIYGYEAGFDQIDETTKNLYLKLRSENVDQKKSAIEDLEKNFQPIFAS